MKDAARRKELAEFLRSRRARLTPADVGLFEGGRRRTPGLRREEVASLAGLGLAWYTWLEQAREIKVSDDVLFAIARALRLTPAERGHLIDLARDLRAPGPTQDDVGISAAQQAMLDALNPYSAHIRDECWDILGWNESFATPVNFDTVPPEERNLLWLVFTHPPMVRLNSNWPKTAAFAVAQFRFECARRLHDPAVIELIERLRDVSPEFTELWAKHDIDSGFGSTAEWTLEAGELVFDRTVFPVGSPNDPGFQHGVQRRLVVLIPKDGSPPASKQAEDAGAA